MKVEQIYSLMNSVQREILGKDSVLNEDLSNLVDVGKEIFSATEVDNYVKVLVDHIGKVIFVNRPYRGKAPSVLMDGWEYGSVLEKVQADLIDAEENESWKLEKGTVYEQDKFTPPTISVKFFNSKVTFEVPLSFTEIQVKESFSNATQANAFLSMLFNTVENSMTVKLEALIMRTINMAIAQTIHSGNGVRAINILKSYNDDTGKALTVKQAERDADYIRYVSAKMGLTIDRLGSMSTLFNNGGKARFTPEDRLHVVMLSEFVRNADVYLQSDTFHNMLTALPHAETVPYWQGSGTDYSFKETSKIDVKIDESNTVSQTGILCVMFDRDALGVCNRNQRITTHYNAKAEFWNNWYKSDGSYFYDGNENVVVFYMADEEAV